MQYTFRTFAETIRRLETQLDDAKNEAEKQKQAFDKAAQAAVKLREEANRCTLDILQDTILFVFCVLFQIPD